jgi:hypothetical protein
MAQTDPPMVERDQRRVSTVETPMASRTGWGTVVRRETEMELARVRAVRQQMRSDIEGGVGNSPF